MERKEENGEGRGREERGGSAKKNGVGVTVGRKRSSTCSPHPLLTRGRHTKI